MALKAVDLTWRQVEAGLPPVGICGRICAVEHCGASLRPFLIDPWPSVKPRSEWPRRFRRSVVRVKPGEWPGLLRGTVAIGIFGFLPGSQLLRDSLGSPLVNGLFGITKGDVHAAGFDVASCILKLIISLVPSNELQRAIWGEVKGLPLFPQWIVMELLKHEELSFP